MQKIVTFLVLAFLMINASAQEWEIPENYLFDSPDACEQYRADVSKCVDWLMFYPIDEQRTKRKLAASFLTSYMAACDNASVALNSQIVNFKSTTPDLVPVFMAGMTKWALENEIYDDRFQHNLAGLKAVMVYYNKNKHILGKDKNVEKFMKMYRKNTLDQYIKDALQL